MFQNPLLCNIYILKILSNSDERSWNTTSTSVNQRDMQFAKRDRFTMTKYLQHSAATYNAAERLRSFHCRNVTAYFS